MIALDDVRLGRVWRAVVVDEAPLAQTDGVDDKRISLVTANRFPIPARRHLSRMRDVEIDMPHLAALIGHQHHVARLKEIKRRRQRIDEEGRDPGRPAGFAGAKRNFAGEHVLIRLAHPVCRPRLQNWIGDIGDAVSGRLARREVGNVRMGFVERHRSGSACRRQIIIADRNPARRRIDREVGRRHGALSGREHAATNDKGKRTGKNGDAQW